MMGSGGWTVRKTVRTRGAVSINAKEVTCVKGNLYRYAVWVDIQSVVDVGCARSV